MFRLNTYNPSISNGLFLTFKNQSRLYIPNEAISIFTFSSEHPQPTPGLKQVETSTDVAFRLEVDLGVLEHYVSQGSSPVALNITPNTPAKVLKSLMKSLYTYADIVAINFDHAKKVANDNASPHLVMVYEHYDDNDQNKRQFASLSPDNMTVTITVF